MIDARDVARELAAIAAEHDTGGRTGSANITRLAAEAITNLHTDLERTRTRTRQALTSASQLHTDLDHANTRIRELTNAWTATRDELAAAAAAARAAGELLTAQQPVIDAAVTLIEAGDRNDRPDATTQDERDYDDAGDHLETVTRTYIAQEHARPCPTCTGPIRETVDMICQSCGTDYGPAPTDPRQPIVDAAAAFIDIHDTTDDTQDHSYQQLVEATATLKHAVRTYRTSHRSATT